MTRRSSAGKSEEDKEDASPAWVNGIKCILNVQAGPSISDWPLHPPISTYLLEVALGMIGGAGDPSHQKNPRVPRRPGTKVSPAQRMKAIDFFLDGKPVVDSCKIMFWFIIGGIFGTLSENMLPDMRVELGDCWYALMLQVIREIPDDSELQDAVFTSLPFMYAQAAYRLLVDGFVEDRKHYVNGGDSLLLKATQIAHFELTGFQLAYETVRRNRHKLFLRRVVVSPYVNQRELVRGRKRQEMFENATGNLGEQPLEFGKMAQQPLEETQLDHVLHGSEQHRRSLEQELNVGKPVWELESTPVPEKLSVKRYEVLKSGCAMLDQHMQDLKLLMDEENEKKSTDDKELRLDFSRCSTPDGSEKSPHCSQHSSPAWPGSPTSAASPSHEVGESPSADLGSEAGAEVTDPNAIKHKRMWRKGVLIAKFSMAVKEDTRSRKEQEVRARKMRQEIVGKNVTTNELPEDFCVRTINTSWVSPSMVALAHAEDRAMLKKPATDSFHLKMKLRPMLQRPMSTPAPRAASSKQSRRRNPDASAQGSQANVDNNRCGTANSAPQTTASLPRVQTGAAKQNSSSKDLHPPAGGGFRSAAVGALSKLSASARGEAKKEMVLQKLESQRQAFLKDSFAIYAKEHDILTGAKKSRSDPKLLKDEEDAYIKKMESLIGGCAKILIAPEGVVNRQQKDGGNGEDAGGCNAGASAVQGGGKK